MSRENGKYRAQSDLLILTLGGTCLYDCTFPAALRIGVPREVLFEQQDLYPMGGARSSSWAWARLSYCLAISSNSDTLLTGSCCCILEQADCLLKQCLYIGFNMINIGKIITRKLVLVAALLHITRKLTFYFLWILFLQLAGRQLNVPLLKRFWKLVIKVQIVESKHISIYTNNIVCMKSSIYIYSLRQEASCWFY